MAINSIKLEVNFSWIMSLHVTFLLEWNVYIVQIVSSYFQFAHEDCVITWQQCIQMCTNTVFD